MNTADNACAMFFKRIGAEPAGIIHPTDVFYLPDYRMHMTYAMCEAIGAEAASKVLEAKYIERLYYERENNGDNS